MALRRKKLRSARREEERLDRALAYAIYLLVFLYALFLLAVWTSSRPALFLAEVRVEGAHAVPAKSIEDLAHALMTERILGAIRRDNAVLYPLHELEREASNLSPRIAHVAATAKGNTLVVTVTEFTPNFLYCLGDSVRLSDGDASTSPTVSPDCYFADEGGYVYAEAPEYIGYPFVAIVASTTDEAVSTRSPIGTRVLTEDLYARIRAYIDGFSRIGLAAHRVLVLPGDDLEIDIGAPWTVLVSAKKDPARTIANLRVVLELLPSRDSEVKRIDLRFGNKVFYK